MKFLTNRTEIAKAMNFGKYPVLRINKEDHRGFTNTDFCVGDDVQIMFHTETHGDLVSKGNVYYDDCNKRYEISSNGAAIVGSFGYSSVMEMYHWANVPTLKAGQTIILIEEYPSKRECRVRMMKVSDKTSLFCQTAAWLEDI